jgi:RND superfamily putative drug exporter
MTPSIAALLGRWFWWPQVVRTRPVPQRWPSPNRSDESPVGQLAGMQQGGS